MSLPQSRWLLFMIWHIILQYLPRFLRSSLKLCMLRPRAFFRLYPTLLYMPNKYMRSRCSAALFVVTHGSLTWMLSQLTWWLPSVWADIPQRPLSTWFNQCLWPISIDFESLNRYDPPSPLWLRVYGQLFFFWLAYQIFKLLYLVFDFSLPPL